MADGFSSLNSSSVRGDVPEFSVLFVDFCEFPDIFSVKTKNFPGHLRLQDEGFEEKKPAEALVLATVPTISELSSTNVEIDIVGTQNIYTLIWKRQRTEPKM